MHHAEEALHAALAAAQNTLAGSATHAAAVEQAVEAEVRRFQAAMQAHAAAGRGAEAHAVTERAGKAVLDAMNLLCLAPIKPTLNRLLVELQG